VLTWSTCKTTRGYFRAKLSRIGGNIAAIPSGHPILNSPAVGSPKELNIPDALLQFIEHGSTASEQRVTVHGRLNPLRASIKQPHTERLLKIGDRIGNSGLGNAKLSSRLGHAAALNSREECMQVPQLEPAADLTFPVDFSCHSHSL
jgi:hypothetical protein